MHVLLALVALPLRMLLHGLQALLCMCTSCTILFKNLASTCSANNLHLTGRVVDKMSASLSRPGVNCRLSNISSYVVMCMVMYCEG